MLRDPTQLVDRTFDILVIGGGIHGAAVAWSAATAGHDVALIERADFASGTSCNSQKIVHGGFRYLQRFDVRRIRRSASERKRLLWLAPHLVAPLRMVAPTYELGARGPASVAVGSALYNWLTSENDPLPDPDRRTGPARSLSKRALLDLVPTLDPNGVRGGATWFDAACYDTERLVVGLIRSAVAHGAVALNYVEAEALLTDNGSATGTRVHDRIDGDRFDVRATHIVNCAGPWLHELAAGRSKSESPMWMAGLNLVVDRVIEGDVGVGLPGRGQSRAALVVTPWRGCSLLGTVWWPHPGDEADAPAPDVDTPRGGVAVPEIQARRLLDGISASFPDLELGPDSIRFVHAGLVPAAPGTTNATARRETRLLDRTHHGIERLVSVDAVKLTTAVGVAEAALACLLGPVEPRPLTEQPRLPGAPDRVGSSASEAPEHIVRSYGSEQDAVLELAGSNAALEGQVRFAVRNEMAIKMTDVVLRRTGLGTAGPPSADEISVVGETMAEELGWSARRVADEEAELDAAYPELVPTG